MLNFCWKLKSTLPPSLPSLLFSSLSPATSHSISSSRVFLPTATKTSFRLKMDSREVIIPERTSSKRKAQRSVSDDDHESLLKRRDDLNASVSKDRKKLRPQQSFDKM